MNKHRGHFATPDMAEPESENSPLDELFARAMQTATERDRLREARREARRLPPESHEGREASEIARALLLKLEWREHALVALCCEQVCTCGRTHFWVEGEYLEHRHIRDSSARWQIIKPREAVTREHHPDLPRRIEYRTMRTDICPSCLAEHGYTNV
jgi:hypothetical protein